MKWEEIFPNSPCATGGRGELFRARPLCQKPETGRCQSERERSRSLERTLSVMGRRLGREVGSVGEKLLSRARASLPRLPSLSLYPRSLVLSPFSLRFGAVDLLPLRRLSPSPSPAPASLTFLPPSHSLISARSAPFSPSIPDRSLPLALIPIPPRSDAVVLLSLRRLSPSPLSRPPRVSSPLDLSQSVALPVSSPIFPGSGSGAPALFLSISSNGPVSLPLSPLSRSLPDLSPLRCRAFCSRTPLLPSHTPDIPLSLSPSLSLDLSLSARRPGVGFATLHPTAPAPLCPIALPLSPPISLSLPSLAHSLSGRRPSGVPLSLPQSAPTPPHPPALPISLARDPEPSAVDCSAT